MSRRNVRQNMFYHFLLEDEEEDFQIFYYLINSLKRKSTAEIIQNRDSEGSYKILIEKYLLSSEDMFVKYFRVTPVIFYNILDHIRNDISIYPSNRVPNPISAEHKLSLVLRYIQIT